MLTKITIDASKVDGQERLDKINQIQLEIHTVLNSSIFRDRVLKMDKHGETSKFKDSPNIDIYMMLMKGAETLKPVEDYEWNIYLTMYSSFKKVIAYTNPGKNLIYLNTKYFDSRHTKLSGSTIVHEQGHKLGFGHDFWATARRPFSICYQLNKVYEECYDILFKTQIRKVKVCHRSWKTLWLKNYCYWIEVAA